jgi:hypothetical protein
MNKRVTIIDICLWMTVLIIFCVGFAQLFTRVSTGVGVYFIWLVTAALLTVKYNIFKDSKVSLSFVWLTIFCGIYITLSLFFFKTSDFVSIAGLQIPILIISMFQFIFIYLICYVIARKNDYDKQLVYIYIISFIINFAFTIRAIAINPNISKMMATGRESHTFGIAGYGYIYAIIFLLPIFLVFIIECKQRKLRSLLLIFVLAHLYFIYKTAYVTALLIVLFEFSLIFLMHIKSIYRLFLIPPVVLFILSFFSLNAFAEILLSFSKQIPIYNISERFREIAVYILTQQKGSALDRIDLYMCSIKGFAKSPIWGNALFYENYSVSGHAEILDILAHGGVLFLLPYLLFIYSVYRYNLIYAKTRLQRNAVFIIFICYIILNCVNTSFSSVAIIFVIAGFIPVFLRYLNQKIS